MGIEYSQNILQLSPYCHFNVFVQMHQLSAWMFRLWIFCVSPIFAIFDFRRWWLIGGDGGVHLISRTSGRHIVRHCHRHHLGHHCHHHHYHHQHVVVVGFIIVCDFTISCEAAITELWHREFYRPTQFIFKLNLHITWLYNDSQFQTDDRNANELAN